METYTLIYGSTVEVHITSLLDTVKPSMPKKQDSLEKERKAHRDKKKATKQELSELEKDLKKALSEKMLLWR